jgi:hypothetical protein
MDMDFLQLDIVKHTFMLRVSLINAVVNLDCPMQIGWHWAAYIQSYI